MKKQLLYFWYSLSLLFLLCENVSAASFSIISPSRVASNADRVYVVVSLDSEGETLSGVAGDFSFPEDLFEVDSIFVDSSIVSLWGKPPSIAAEKYLDRRTHIVFEGIFPGGYKDITSPFSSATSKGKLFTVSLIPKTEGEGVFLLSNGEVYRFSENAEKMHTEEVISPIRIPVLSGDSKKRQVRAPVMMIRSSLHAFVTRTPLVHDNAWYVTIQDNDTHATPVAYYVAERNTYSAESVAPGAWKEVTNPYVLFYQDRSMNVHVKVLYSDNTYSTVSIPAVDNRSLISSISRILVSIAIAVLVLYRYGSSIVTFFKKLYR